MNHHPHDEQHGASSSSSSSLPAGVTSSAGGTTTAAALDPHDNKNNKNDDSSPWTLQIKTVGGEGQQTPPDFCVTVHPADPVSRLYDAIGRHTGWAHREQRLIYRGRLLHYGDAATNNNNNRNNDSRRSGEQPQTAAQPQGPTATARHCGFDRRSHDSSRAAQAAVPGRRTRRIRGARMLPPQRHLPPPPPTMRLLRRLCSPPSWAWVERRNEQRQQQRNHQHHQYQFAPGTLPPAGVRSGAPGSRFVGIRAAGTADAAHHGQSQQH